MDLSKNKKIALISGVTGQDGAYLSKFLIEKGYIVKITTNNSIEVTKKVLFNDLIKELNEYTKNS